MNNLTERIANLPPEKRALLLKKLKNSHNENEEPGLPDKKKKNEFPDSISSNENIRLNITKPGNLKSIQYEIIPRIPPKPQEIQIKVKAAGINYRDLMIALGIYPPTPGLPSNMGTDYAGVVTAVGNEVRDFRPGDEVIALSARPFSENDHFSAYINVYNIEAVKKPENLNFEQAASIPTAFFTAYYALVKRAGLKEKERVLIHSATGGVGLSAIQVARWCKAEIFATAGSDEKRDYLKSLGIIHVMNSRTLDFADTILDITKGKGVDVILNTLSGEAVKRGLEILAPFGRFMEINKQDIYTRAMLPLEYFKNGLTYTAIDLGLFFADPLQLKDLLAEICTYFNKQIFVPVLSQLYPYSRIGDALLFMSQSKHMGKLVLSYNFQEQEEENKESQSSYGR